MASADIEGYRELIPLGQGRASDLYRTQLPATERWVVVKVFRFTLPDDSAERRWRHDCQHARSLSAHPNLVALYDAGLTQDRRPYLTMQFLEGGSVAERLSLGSQGTFSPSEAVRICAEVCRGLEAGHAADVVHRFIQPSSILLTADETPLLTELGITLFSQRWEAAGYLDESVPHHTAPEILERDAPGPAADVYSMASVLYTMITGSSPHQGADSTSALLLHILQHQPLPLEAPGVTARLNEVLQGALDADPAKRPADASALADTLAGLLPELREVEESGAGPDPSTITVEEPGQPEPTGPVDAGETSDDPAPMRAAIPSGEIYAYAYSEPDGGQGPPAASPISVAGPEMPAPEVAEPPVPVPSEPPEPLIPVSYEPADHHHDEGEDEEDRHQPGQELATTSSPGEIVPYVDDVRRWKRRALIAVAATITLLLALVVDNLRTDDDSSSKDEQTPADTGAVRPGDDAVSPPPSSTAETGPSQPTDDELPVPTGLTAQDSEAGVQLEWDESDTASFAVLVLAEASPPQVMTTTRGPSLFIPATELEADDGYCFAVARLDAIATSGGTEPIDEDGALTEEDEEEDIGPAFSSVTCIRGAAEDTVRTS